MAVELDHSFSTAKPIDESYAAILDLERRLPGGHVNQEVVSGRRRGTGARRHHPQGRVLGPERVRACRDRHARSLEELP